MVAKIVGFIPPAVLRYREELHKWEEKQAWLARKRAAAERQKEQDARRVDSGRFNRPHLGGSRGHS